MNLIIQSAINTIKSPKQTLNEIISSGSYKIEKKHFLFVILVQTYGIILSFVLSLNIMSLITFPMAIGMIYHFAKRARDKYREHSSNLPDDDISIYKVAFCFALTGAPGFVISVINTVIAILSLIGLEFLDFFSLILSLVSFVVTIYFVLVMMSIITQKDFDLVGLVIIFVKAFIDMILAILGFKTVFTVFDDFKKHFA